VLGEAEAAAPSDPAVAVAEELAETEVAEEVEDSPAAHWVLACSMRSGLHSASQCSEVPWQWQELKKGTSKTVSW
jgi:hypothetical protein